MLLGGNQFIMGYDDDDAVNYDPNSDEIQPNGNPAVGTIA